MHRHAFACRVVRLAPAASKLRSVCATYSLVVLVLMDIKQYVKGQSWFCIHRRFFAMADES